MKTGYFRSQNSLSVQFPTGLKIFSKGSPEFDKVWAFIEADDDDGLTKYLTDFETKIGQKSNGVFTVKEGIVFIKDSKGNDRQVPRVLGERIRSFYEDGLPYQPLVKFWERLQNNPSYDTVQRLFECMDKNHHPILTDGRILAWKRVRSDRKDFYSGKFDNSDGERPEMPRNEVDDDHKKDCSFGLHISSFSYAKYHYHSGEGVLIEVAVDPSDIVSIPFDYNDQKMRVITYEVLREITEERKDNLSKVYENESDEEW